MFIHIPHKYLHPSPTITGMITTISRIIAPHALPCPPSLSTDALSRSPISPSLKADMGWGVRLRSCVEVYETRPMKRKRKILAQLPQLNLSKRRPNNNSKGAVRFIRLFSYTPSQQKPNINISNSNNQHQTYSTSKTQVCLYFNHSSTITFLISVLK